MAKKNVQDHVDGFETVEEALTRSEQFLENNQKTITLVLAVIIVVVLGILGYHKYVKQPKEIQAQNEAFMAQRYFEMDSLNLALNGDGMNAGFLNIIDEYGSTTVGNTANYYAGICCLRTGQFEEAIDHLGNFSHEGRLAGAMAISATGDAYMELGDIKKAANLYLEASKTQPNEFTTPAIMKKAAIAFELNKDYPKAKEMLENLQKIYPGSSESRDAEKYIARLNVLMTK